MARPREHEPPLPDALAYFLTWSTYGTWLPGDERGWIECRHGWQLPDPIRKREAEAIMAEDACRLDGEQRAVAERQVAETCAVRGWQLHVVNCRSNHLHVVVSADRPPTAVRNQMKAWCTRRLKELESCRQQARGGSRAALAIRENWWAERGSGLFINTEDSLEAVIQYVRDGQDRHQPEA